MGLLVNGQWQDKWYDTKKTAGRFQREQAQFRQQIEVDPKAKFVAEANRYHLYVSLACPWAHRTLIYRSVKQLQSLISVSVVDPYMGAQGWQFFQDAGQGDQVNDCQYLHQVYCLQQADYTGRVTVPVLWDKKLHCIVNNESADIIRLFNSQFDELTSNRLDLYPKHLQQDIDALNGFIYDNINNGVYKAGFASEQTVYEQALLALFTALDELEVCLSKQRYLLGKQICEADWRLFTTLIRFDAVYVGHFKCNLRRIADYPALSAYLRDLYQQPGIAATVNIEHIKQHYYGSHPSINPNAIVPVGPQLDFKQPHHRQQLG